jgi:hypothetical protein
VNELNVEMLAKGVNYLLVNDDMRRSMIDAGLESVQQMRGALTATLKGLEPYINPLVVKALINVTGIYPVGTVVILDTGELAIVAAPHTDPKRLHQPIVKIISDPSGRWLERPVRAFLSDQDPATGRAKRAIVKTTDPDRYGVRTGEYFL